QSGFIHAVGFDMYQRMLEDAVQELSSDGVTPAHKNNGNGEFEPRIDFPFDAYLPNDYVEEPEHRVELYRRLSGAQEVEDLRRLTEEIGDRYGSPPEAARHLFDLIELKIGCWRAGVARLELKDQYLLAELHPGSDGQWGQRLQQVVGRVQGFPVEFTGGDPPALRLRWNGSTPWPLKIDQTNALLRQLQ
ncbi:MAG: hypothetical protein C4524_07315, partial [Candidatus Zixiibacteriota bacterium]